MTPAKRLLLWAAALGDWAMRTTVDRRVCRWVEDTKGDDDA